MQRHPLRLRAFTTDEEEAFKAAEVAGSGCPVSFKATISVTTAQGTPRMTIGLPPEFAENRITIDSVIGDTMILKVGEGLKVCKNGKYRSIVHFTKKGCGLALMGSVKAVPLRGEFTGDEIRLQGVKEFIDRLGSASDVKALKESIDYINGALKANPDLDIEINNRVVTGTVTVKQTL